MQFDQVKEVLGLGDEAELWRERWALSQAAYHDELLWVLDDAGPAELAYMMRLPDEAGEALQAARAALADQPALRRLLWHCHHELVATWPPDYSDVTPALWKGPPIDRWPMLPFTLGPAADLFYLFAKGMGLRRLRAMHAQRGIDEAITRDSTSDILLWLEDFRVKHSRWGLGPHSWIMTSLSGQTIRLGRLQFAFDTHHKPFDIYRHRQTGEVAAIVVGSHRFRQCGQFDGATGITDPQAWTTQYVEDANTVTGHRVDHDGNVEREASALSLDDWARVMRDGDKVIAVHIPATGPMDAAACDASFARACAFYPEHFPEWNFKAFTCDSWLMDSQLAKYLPPQSNIVRFLRRFALLPHPVAGESQTWNRVFACPPPGPAELDALPQDTSVQRALVAHARAGGKWWYGGATMLPEDAARPT